MEAQGRRHEMKRAMEDVQEESKPKRRRKVKFPRLEDWGEMTQEVESIRLLTLWTRRQTYCSRGPADSRPRS